MMKKASSKDKEFGQHLIVAFGARIPFFPFSVLVDVRPFDGSIWPDSE